MTDQPLATPEPRTILYIEDDPASRTLVERTLRHAGFRVVVAERGLDGIDMARKEQPDLILTDINLPDLSGRELTTMLRSDRRFERTPIVALTAQVLRDQRELALAAGLSGYLTKPLDIEALPKQIEHYLAGAQDEIESDALVQAKARYTQEVVARLEARIRGLQQSNAQLARLDRMKDTFIQLTAHELRTPLTLVYGYSRLLEDNAHIKALMQSNNDVRMLVAGLVGAILRMQGIIAEILTESRIVTNRIDLSIGPVNLGQVVAQALAAYADALPQRRITVHFDKAEFPERMTADWEMLELAFRNLISNAIKFTPDGGSVRITARMEDDVVRVSIKDTGIGIAASDLLTIFERFHTLQDIQLHSTSKTAFRGGGLGLGLAVCKGIVEAHGGRIWAESPGFDPETCPGSEFIITLPLVVPSFKAE